MNDDYGTEDEVVPRLLSELQWVHRFCSDKPDFKTLKELASELSSYLPQVSDSTVLAIDDLLYRGKDVAGTRVVSETSIKFLAENCYQIFHDAVFKHLTYDCDIELVFLQLLEFLPDDILLKPQFEQSVKDMMRYNHSRNMERQLKIFKIAVEKHRDSIKFHVVDSEEKRGCPSNLRYMVSPLWVLRLTDETDYEHPDKKRWASWVSEMSTIILEKLPFGKEDLKFPLIEYIQTCKHQKEDLYNQEFAGIVFQSPKEIQYMLKPWIVFEDEPLLFTDHLYEHFMSAKDKTQRVGRVQSFVKGLRDRGWDASKTMHHGFLNYSPEEIRDVVAYFKEYSYFIKSEICQLFRVLLCYPSVKLMKLVSRYSYDIGSWTYLSKDITSCSPYLTFKEETVGLMNEYFTSPNNLYDFEASGESSEKRLVHCFHKFMKRLQILDIFYNIWLMLEDDTLAKGMFPPGFIDAILNPKGKGKACPIRESIKKCVINPRERGRIHFALQVILRKCPFLILPHHRDICHMENLIKLLSGRNISKALEEALYYTLKLRKVY